MTPDPKRQNVPDDPSDVPMFGLPSVPGDLDPLERRATANPTPATDDELVDDEPPAPAVMVEDPRDVARRLVDEARKRAAPPPPDPRDVARQLAEEARRKAASRPNLADLAPKPAPPKPEPPKAAEPKPELGKRLSDRAMPTSRAAPVDALAAIETARKAEEDATRRPRAAAPPAVAPAAPAAPAVRAADVASKLLPGLEVIREIRIGNLAVAKALWTAHRARAAATHDLALVGAASAILDAIDRLPPGALVALDATVAGQHVGLWIDTHRGALLAVSGQPEFTLAGF